MAKQKQPFIHHWIIHGSFYLRCNTFLSSAASPLPLIQKNGWAGKRKMISSFSFFVFTINFFFFRINQSFAGRRDANPEGHSQNNRALAYSTTVEPNQFRSLIFSKTKTTNEKNEKKKKITKKQTTENEN